MLLFLSTDVPSIKKRAALQFLKTRSGPTPLGHQGIVTECCYNACSFEHIENYCAAPPGHETANPTHAPLVRIGFLY
ncbi:hypothetical protein DPMN_052044 [Dreissena polymorpha]|uniref:Insulin-like domain-containing protein n=1 Tax=Dreissena polymorpha TaxID=45954 RepID=A0A9D4CKJ0_DREPO|nr:hypothetical protein DPMN_052044 [Dreissena polymorpha]